MATRNLSGQEGWTVRRAGPAGGGRRGIAAASGVVPPQFLRASGVTVAESLEATPPAEAASRGAGPPDLVLETDVRPGESAVLAVRHPSGALTFHPGVARAARSGGRAAAGASAVQFRVPVRRVTGDTGQRGLVAAAVRVTVIKVAKIAVDKAIDVAMPKLAAAWERQAWSKKKLEEGWFRVAPTAGTPASLALTPGVPDPGARSLLLVHGTFSNAANAFDALAASNFFERVRPLYDTRIYAFNHFSISRTPDENARMLLEGLPAGEHRFDAITHSRGGLVLRSLVEHRELHGALADRFRLGHAVLVASPNDGTPLATPARWEQAVNWFANLMEVLPDNPFTTGAEFVSEALVWLAAHLANDLPGLRAMDGAGALVADLQSPPGPPANAYSALVSNVHPDEALWQRALDVGVDAFFGSANDLVVPTEGGWRTDRDGAAHVPASRIGCFGPGGNIDAGSAGPVPHTRFFGRGETGEFLARALANQPQGLAAIDPTTPLPDRRFPRSARSARSAAAGVDVEAAVDPATLPDAPKAVPGTAIAEIGRPHEDFDTFHIVIMDMAEPKDGAADDVPIERPSEPEEGEPVEDASRNRKKKKGPRFARVLAAYGGARVTTFMRLGKVKDTDPPTRFGEIIRVHERIKAYTNRVQGSLPTDAEMIAFGTNLFETLFTGDVRRLYDEARSRQRGHRLDLVLTSMIPWIAEKPWEFAYDAGRQSFLATEEIHFVRNVLTAVPADVIEPCRGPLKILVASAQPVGFGHLSIEQEVEVIRRGFEPLIDAGLIEVEVLPRATPAAIHGHLSTGDFSVVHFIGHGEFDEATQEGFLLFEDTRGGAFRLGQRSVREIFCKRGVSLVFLNACQSGSGGKSDFNKGVAQALVSHGLPALVANQYSVLDSSATSFAQHFYWSLAQGMSLGAAARESRIAVNYSLQGELIDWAVPVLYARDPNTSLCRLPDKVTRPPATVVSGASRRAAEHRPIRVAVWDIDDVFPSLDRTLARLHAAQKEFGFELVDMSAPLDAWDLEHKSPDGEPYLFAEKLARRLASKTVELRVDLLACVTRHWLRDEERFKLFGWWPRQRTPQVVIFSCAGFPNLQADSPATDQAIANAMVSALAGFFGGLDSHRTGPKNCPLFHNEDRLVKYLIGQQKFDPRCRKKLQGLSAGTLPALEALLEVFQ